MSEPAAHAGDTFLERRFRFAANGTTLARDTMAGVTTFIVMSYIIFVNPQILSFAGIQGLEEIGLPFNQVLAATCLVAGEKVASTLVASASVVGFPLAFFALSLIFSILLCFFKS